MLFLLLADGRQKTANKKQVLHRPLRGDSE
jgi:hypothetical protein